MKNEMNTHSMVVTTEDALREYMRIKQGDLTITELKLILETRHHNRNVAELHPAIADDNQTCIEKHIVSLKSKIKKREEALKSPPATRKRRGTKA